MWGFTIPARLPPILSSATLGRTTLRGGGKPATAASLPALSACASTSRGPARALLPVVPAEDPRARVLDATRSTAVVARGCALDRLWDRHGPGSMWGGGRLRSAILTLLGCWASRVGVTAEPARSMRAPPQLADRPGTGHPTQVTNSRHQAPTRHCSFQHTLCLSPPPPSPICPPSLLPRVRPPSIPVPPPLLTLPIPLTVSAGVALSNCHDGCHPQSLRCCRPWCCGGRAGRG